MKSSNVKKKKKRVRELSNVTIKLSHDVGIAQCEDGTVKCEKKKSKRTTECDKRTVTCEVGIAQCENETVKCEKNVT